MRNRALLLGGLAAAAMAADPGGPAASVLPDPRRRGLRSSRRKRDREPPSPEALARDLRHAEEALAAARTPGSRRKAQRKVDAILSQMDGAR